MLRAKKSPDRRAGATKFIEIKTYPNHRQGTQAQPKGLQRHTQPGEQCAPQPRHAAGLKRVAFLICARRPAALDATDCALADTANPASISIAVVNTASFLITPSSFPKARSKILPEQTLTS
jgi:hypothetical protein